MRSLAELFICNMDVMACWGILKNLAYFYFDAFFGFFQKSREKNCWEMSMSRGVFECYQV
jgi:hypothetical protein